MIRRNSRGFEYSVEEMAIIDSYDDIACDDFIYNDYVSDFEMMSIQEIDDE